jgi:phosphoribosylformimino-5-aminoimidazole carboxamide ribotide isomerase
VTIYPAIDIYEGQVVRLTRGDFSKMIIYHFKPEVIASQWVNEGAEWLHVVDLEGARAGSIKNLEAILKIRDSVPCKIQLGGGLRKFEDIATLVRMGIDRVVLGTVAYDKNFLNKVMDHFGEKIAVSLDVHQGKIRTSGWAEETNIELDKAISLLNPFLLQTLIYTDIQKDGMLKGPNLNGLKTILRLTTSRVILSGGVSSLEDVREICKIPEDHFEGIIIGKALYEKRISLNEAIQIAKTAASRRAS